MEIKTIQPRCASGNQPYPPRSGPPSPSGKASLKNIQPQLCCGEMQLIRRLRRHLPFQGKVKTGLRPFFPNPPKSKNPAASLMLRGFFYSFSTKSSISKGWFTKCFPPLALRKVSGRKPQVTERQGRWEFLAVSMSTSVSPT